MMDRHERWLLSAAALAYICTGTPAAAGIAQTQPDAQQAAQDDGSSTEASNHGEDTASEIVVTGSRAVAEGFVSTKRHATNIVDSIGEDEAGNLPASNAAELISVLPGVLSFTDRTGELNLTTTEARFASVRGIRPDLDITTLDGFNLAIPNEAGRSNFLDFFPVNLAKRVEILKTFSAENDGNAIGGQINVVTRSGFDYAKPLFTVTASARFDELNDGVLDNRQPFSAALVFARPLSSKVALAFSANFDRRDTFTPSRENVGRVAFNDDGSRATFIPGTNNFIGGVPGNGIAVPSTNRLYAGNSQIDRWGFAGKLDSKPDDSTYLWLVGTYSQLNQHVYETYSDVRQPFICFVFAGCVDRAENQNGATGTIIEQFEDAAFSEMQTSHNLSQLTAVEGGIQRDLGDRARIELKGAFSEARQDQTDYFSFFGQDAREIRFDYDISDPMSPIFTVADADAVFDPSTYHLRKVDYIPLHLKERVGDVQLNLAYNADADDRGLGVKTGLRFKVSDRDKREKFVTNTVTPLGSAIDLTEVQTPYEPLNIGIPGVTAASRPVLGNPIVRNRVLLPLLGDPAYFTPSVLTDLVNNYTLNEKTYAAYVQGQYRSDSVEIVGGLRYERTTLHGTGYRQTDGGAFEPVSNRSSDGFLLPSLTINWNATPQLKVRAGYSRSLGRPPYDALAPRGETLTTDPQLGTAMLSRSNPDLKPRRSDNFDLAAEWYFDGGRSLLSVGGFYKRIRDEIFVATRIVPMTIDGVTYQTTISEPMNTSSAKLHGLEFNLVKVFSFLPAPWDGFGIQANATLIDGNFSLQRPRLDGNGTQTPGFIPAQPTQIYNAALFYSKRDLDVNISLNRTSSYVVGFFSDAPQNDIYLLGRTVLNAKASYALTSNVRLFVEGNNLLSRDLYEVSGPPKLQSIRRVYRVGRTISIGATFTW